VSSNVKGVLAGLLLAVLAGAGGWWLCHAQGVSAAHVAADSAAVQQRRADSVNAVLRLAAQHSDSLARQDSTRAETLSRQQIVEHVRRVAAELSAASATVQLGQAQTAADSLPIYRDSLVPALHAENASLGRELAVSDSGRLAYRDAFQQQRAANGTLLQIHYSDSALIFSQRQALLKQAAVSPIVFDVWQKLGYAGETAGFGLATVTACQAHVASLGCIVGTALTVRRLIAAKGRFL
jgi:hypothetical protein